jgi:hypothetical protein
MQKKLIFALFFPVGSAGGTLFEHLFRRILDHRSRRGGLRLGLFRSRSLRGRFLGMGFLF